MKTNSSDPQLGLQLALQLIKTIFVKRCCTKKLYLCNLYGRPLVAVVHS